MAAEVDDEANHGEMRGVMAPCPAGSIGATYLLVESDFLSCVSCHTLPRCFPRSSTSYQNHVRPHKL